MPSGCRANINLFTRSITAPRRVNRMSSFFKPFPSPCPLHAHSLCHSLSPDCISGAVVHRPVSLVILAAADPSFSTDQPKGNCEQTPKTAPFALDDSRSSAHTVHTRLHPSSDARKQSQWRFARAHRRTGKNEDVPYQAQRSLWRRWDRR